LYFKYYFFIIIKSLNIKNSIVCVLNIIIFIMIKSINITNIIIFTVIKSINIKNNIIGVINTVEP